MEVKAYKDSNGKLYEKENDYILAEAEIKRKDILKRWSKISDIIENNPEYYFQFIKGIVSIAINQGLITEEELEKHLNKELTLFVKEKEIKQGKTAEYDGSHTPDYEPMLWGNDILDGYDVNR